MNISGHYLLAIESAIAGGSLALFDNNEVISSRCGEWSVSRAEDLLPSIISMLNETGLSKDELSRVAVSLGPGSYTGLRIGIATVMGLKRGLDIDTVGVPLFRAITSNDSDAIIAVPMGKADVCFVMSDDPHSPNVVPMERFVETIRAEGKRVLVHSALKERLGAVNVELELLNLNLAEYIGQAAMSLPPSDTFDPIYVQNPRFG